MSKVKNFPDDWDEDKIHSTFSDPADSLKIPPTASVTVISLKPSRA